ncbi:MAG: gamma-glutamylcyclotransferase [Burkholderiales bacterium]
MADFRAALPRGDLWVFGYGSLMWSPGFQFAERAVGLLRGYHRALCILSTSHRGTLQRPGLVMGLCRGGSCWGMAFRVPAAQVPAALARLWNREMPRRVYRARRVPVRVSRGRRVRALAFIADPSHPQFRRELDLKSRAQLVAQGVGRRGACTEYLRSTLRHMAELGVSDPHLARVLATAETMRARAVRRRAR